MSWLMLGCVLLLVSDIYALLWLFASSMQSMYSNARKCIHDVTCSSIQRGVKWLNSCFTTPFALGRFPFRRLERRRICWKIKVNENQCLALGDDFRATLCLYSRWWKSYTNDRIMMMILSVKGTGVLKSNRGMISFWPMIHSMWTFGTFLRAQRFGR